MPPPAKKNEKDDGQDKKDDEPKEKITLPRAIQMCIAQNYRLRAGAERIRQAEAELVTASLIPNMSVYTDYQLIPVQTANINNQLGPPEADVLLTVPIDWLLFGKRVAAMQAARLGIDVSSADYADLHRLQVARTVDVLTARFWRTKAYLDLAEDNLAELQEIEKTTQMLAKNKKAGRLELDRIKLAVHEALLERHDRELAWDVARTRLRPLLGRTAADPDYEVDGKMAVAAVVPPPTLKAALALADAHRADLISDRLDIERARRRRRIGTGAGPSPASSVIPMLQLSKSGSHHRLSQRLHGGVRPDHDLAAHGSQSGQYPQGPFPAARTAAYLSRRSGRRLRRGGRRLLAEFSDAVEHIEQLFNTLPDSMKAAHDLQKNMTEAFLSGERRLHDLLNAHHAYRERLAHVVEFQSTYWHS